MVESPFALRLLPVAFGTLFLWAFFRWCRALFGAAASLAALVLLAFLPSLVIVSTELRSYAPMLCLTAAALAALERALGTASGRWLGVFAALSGLALLSHYAALWIVLAAFAYGTVRVLARPAPARFIGEWAAAAGAIAGLCAFLYATHVSRLRGGAMEREAQAEWLRASYGHAGDGPWGFLGRQTLAVFEFLFSTPAAGIAALALLLAGLAILARNRSASAILIAAPFALAAAAGLLGLYPYGGTRHSIELAPFAAAGIGVALARLTGERLWVAVLLAAALAPAAFAIGL